MTIEFIPIADLVDEIGPDVRSCDTQVHDLGGRLGSYDKISTVKCFQDSALLKKVLSESLGDGALVVNGNAPVHTVLVGNVVAGLGKDNGWVNVVVNDAICGSKLIGEMDFGYKVLGTNPRKSTKTGEGERDVVVSFGGIGFAPSKTPYIDSDGIVVR